MKEGGCVDDNFLLTTDLAQRLYHECAARLPVIDYHNHLNVKDLMENRAYGDLAELWLLSDPYKHRAMRICGVPEKLITGDAGNFEKFQAWMGVLPQLMGNPLYDWSILEMKRIFDIELIPGETDTLWLWNSVNEKLREPEFSPRGLLSRFHVEYASPCARLTDDISGFGELNGVAPSLRGDDVAAADETAISQLEEMIGRTIVTLEDFARAIGDRLDAFQKAGCRFADHALDDGFRFYADDGRNEDRFAALRRGESLGEAEKGALTSCVLTILANEYAKRNWTMQLHIGAARSTSSRLRRLAGPAGGYAGIGHCCDVVSLTKMLDRFEQNEHGMPKILLFTLNPADNAVMSVLSGSYSQDGVAGKVQQGPAWWWCDHLQGMREVFDTISSYSVLSVFIGMTTDSRSILSFVRHEYFRRALCGWIGDKVARGELPNAWEPLNALVENVCYYNAKRRVNL